MAGLRVTAMAVRHSRGRGGKRGVERAWSLAVGSRERRDAVAHLSASSDPAGSDRSRGRAAVRVGERADGWGYPVSGCVREREGADARGASLGRPAGLLAGPRPVSYCFLFPFCLKMLDV